MMKPIKLLIALLLAAGPSPLRAQTDTTVFSLLDLARPGLERVAALHAAGDDKATAEALLDYYRRRTGVVCPEANLADITITPDEQRWADEAMHHRFFVHKGYQPSYFYGDDIDWEYWPVKDNELRWQLHRAKPTASRATNTTLRSGAPNTSTGCARIPSRRMTRERPGTGRRPKTSISRGAPWR